jgi:phenylacetate-CoA ligase
MSVATDIYKHLPLWAQNHAVSAYGVYWKWLRFGPGYRNYLRGYLDRERFTAAQWQEWQQARLGSLLRSASTTVPYYRDGWTPAQHRAAQAGVLADLPLLEKEPLRSNPQSFLSTSVRPHPRFTYHTSGSTGTPIQTIWKVSEIRDSLALREARSARWAGVSFTVPRATFSGRMAEPDPNSKGPFYRFNSAENQVYFSPFHLRPDTARFYLEALRLHDVQWMTGYAVSYYLLAQLILEHNLKAPKVKAIITTSEKVTPGMRDVMERAFQSRVYEEYSTVESSLFASECEHGRLHMSPDVAVVEILRPDGSLCDPGEPGEVVATSLIRNYQIFVRYRLGDVAAWDDRPCDCGRNMPVVKEVVGRLEDVVIGLDGRRMVRFHGIFVDQPHIREGQIIQEELDRIRVKLVPSEGFSPSDVQDVIHRVQQRLGPSVNVIVEEVTAIPRTKAGKFKAVVGLPPEKRARIGEEVATL